MKRILILILRLVEMRGLESRLDALQADIEATDDAESIRRMVEHRCLLRDELVRVRGSYIALLPPGVRPTWEGA